MAITGTYEFNGLAVPTAIALVEYIWFRSPYEMTFQVPIYVNEAQRDAGSPLASYSYTTLYDPAEGDVYSQCYTYLLTLPEYAGWSEIP